MTSAVESAARIRVRPAELRDAPALARLSGQLGYPNSMDDIECRLNQILARPDHAVFVAEAFEQGAPVRVLGWVHGAVRRILESDPFVEIGGMIVDEERRGMGIGRLLMDQLEPWARNAGCVAITVRSNVIREGAHLFYQRLGFAAFKTQRVFRKQLAP
jgi:GNAT superfamily N-acetyltransferase